MIWYMINSILEFNLSIQISNGGEKTPKNNFNLEKLVHKKAWKLKGKKKKKYIYITSNKKICESGTTNS